ncbi:hypothetical protein BS47DRAFT_1396198 [Hydnum rufescens UP504]|uniref:Uncharacterized protein n=1 Tax=Hydnum rufescens UP504 TaxID=1448309 RepID=A0A9P6ARM3_9AGAM|nr:hypothetical protein BS47DRAFT_1396198 [Hydnum rufescens UP504]
MVLPLRESNKTPAPSWMGEAKCEENALDFAVIMAHELLATGIVFVEIGSVVILVESLTGSVIVGTESIVDVVVSSTKYVSVETERITFQLDVEGTVRATLRREHQTNINTDNSN